MAPPGLAHRQRLFGAPHGPPPRLAPQHPQLCALLGGSAPNSPGVGYGGGQTPYVSRKSCGGDPRRWGLGVPWHPKAVSQGDRGHRRPRAWLPPTGTREVSRSAPLMWRGQPPQPCQTTREGPRQPRGAGPFPRHIGRTCCAGGCLAGDRCAPSPEPHGIGKIFQPWLREQENTGTGPWLSPDRVRPSILPQHPGTGVRRLLWWGLWGTPEGPLRITPQRGRVGRCWVAPRWGGSQPAPTALAQPCSPQNSPLWVRVSLGCEAQPSRSPPILGRMVPRPDPARAGALGGLHPEGCPGGGWGVAPLRTAQRLGCRLPTCLPLTVVFPPELQICLGFAVIWPGALLGRAGTAFRMRLCCQAGGRAGTRDPHLGLGVQGSWEGAFGGVLGGLFRGRCIASRPKASPGCPCAAAVPSPATILQCGVHPGGISG